MATDVAMLVVMVIVWALLFRHHRKHGPEGAEDEGPWAQWMRVD